MFKPISRLAHLFDDSLWGRPSPRNAAGAVERRVVAAQGEHEKAVHDMSARRRDEVALLARAIARMKTGMPAAVNDGEAQRLAIMVGAAVKQVIEDLDGEASGELVPLVGQEKHEFDQLAALVVPAQKQLGNQQNVAAILLSNHTSELMLKLQSVLPMIQRQREDCILIEEETKIRSGRASGSTDEVAVKGRRGGAAKRSPK